MKIGVIGAGSFGTTLANLLAEKGENVRIWAHNKEIVGVINNSHYNPKYLKDIKLNENLVAYENLEDVVPTADVLISAVPSSVVREMAQKIAPLINKDKEYKLVSVSKGLEYESFELMTQIFTEVLPNNVKIAALSGPNHAEEIAKKLPTATVIASRHPEILDNLVEIFTTEYFKAYPLEDEYGVEICGAAKNITAIAIGICDGLGLGDNAKASIMTLGLTEMNRIGKFFGVKRATFFGIAGVGDLIATCTSKHSRNRYYGEEIAKGKTFDQIRDSLNGMIAEGVKAAKSIYYFAKKNEIELPLTTEIYKILYENKKLDDAMKDLIKLI